MGRVLRRHERLASFTLKPLAKAWRGLLQRMPDDRTDGAGPFCKWLGSKRALLPTLVPLLPLDVRERVYREPFLGGAAMFFHLQPKRAVLSDTLEPLIRTYEAVRDQPDALMKTLDGCVRTRGLGGGPPNSRERYEEERREFNAKIRDGGPFDVPSFAAAFIYLNKMGFNGLCRFNGKGLYNTPYGKRPNATVYEPATIRACSAALQRAEIRHASYDYLLDEAEAGDVIYLDPPYVPLTETSDFTGYAGGSWSEEEHAQLSLIFRVLDRRGCLLAMSNSDTPLVRELYEGFDLTEIQTPRAVAAKGSSRGKVQELVIRNTSRWSGGRKAFSDGGKDGDEVRRSLVCSFGGGGGGAAGFQRAQASLFGQASAFDLVGSFDKDGYACEAFGHLTGVEQVQIDAREMTPNLMREFYGARSPFAVFGSPPCQGASKLLPTEKSKLEKYGLMNELALVNTRLILDAWPNDLPAFILYENVPNITSRASAMLGEVRKLLTDAGYVLQDGFHECRHVGDLAQRRKRWFLVARNPEKVPAFLYLPPHQPGKVCGDVLNELPMPGDPEGGPMHALPAISALNWWRLWAIPAGGDWRDLLPDDGTPRRARFRRHHIERWSEPSVTIGGSGSNGPCGVADPRNGGSSERHHPLLGMNLNQNAHLNLYTVTAEGAPVPTITGATRPGSGAPSYADPIAERFRGYLGVLGADEPSGVVTGRSAPLDLVPAKECFPKAYAVIDRETEPSHTIAGTSTVGCGTYAITDKVPPHPLNLALGCSPRAGAYGVIGEVAPTIIARAKIDNSAVALADPKPIPPPFVVLSYAQAKLVADGHVTVPFAVVDPDRQEEPLAIVEDMAKPPFRWVDVPGKKGKAKRKKVTVPLVLISEDGTWHRPLTTLELGVLQGLPWRHQGKALDFGGGTTKQRQLIGNMVPPPVGEAMGGQMLMAGLASDANRSFVTNGSHGVWVTPTVRRCLERLAVRVVGVSSVLSTKRKRRRFVILDDVAEEREGVLHGVIDRQAIGAPPSLRLSPRNVGCPV